MLDTESQESYGEWSTPLRLGAWLGHFGFEEVIEAFLIAGGDGV